MYKSIGLALICTIFTSIGQLCFKLGSNQMTSFLTFFNIYVIAGLVSYGLGSVLFIYALKKGQLSVVAPLISLTFVWVTILSVFVLKEVVSIMHWIGIAAIVAGVALIGRGGVSAS